MDRNDEMKRVEVVVRGRVQGVSFRYHSQQLAIDLGLTGWVANQADGSVMAIAEGNAAALTQWITYLHQGPSAARVSAVDLQWQAATGEFNRFTVRYLSSSAQTL